MKGVDIKLIDDCGGKNIPLADVSIGPAHISILDWTAQKVRVRTPAHAVVVSLTPIAESSGLGCCPW